MHSHRRGVPNSHTQHPSSKTVCVWRPKPYELKQKPNALLWTYTAYAGLVGWAPTQRTKDGHDDDSTGTADSADGDQNIADPSDIATATPPSVAEIEAIAFSERSRGWLWFWFWSAVVPPLAIDKSGFSPGRALALPNGTPSDT